MGRSQNQSSKSVTIRVDDEVYALIQERRRELYQIGAYGNAGPSNNDAVKNLLQSAETDRRLRKDSDYQREVARIEAFLS